MEHLDVLAAAAASSPAGSEGSSEQPATGWGGRQRRRTQHARGGSRGGSPEGTVGTTTGVGVGGSLTKTAVMARVAEEHGARLAGEPDSALAEWAADVHDQLAAADAAFLAARGVHQAADAQRATARDAFRADQKSEAKSAAWHAKVATAQAAHEALREAREDLYRLQALAELLAKELQRRRVAGGGLGSGGASPPMAAGGEGGASGGGGALAVEERLLAPPAPQGTKRKRGAPPEECPYCCHSYTVRDGLSSRLDAAGNRLHLRRCQCRKKTPPCRNCPECKQRPDVMQLAADAEAAFELCQRLHSCPICACKCPGAGKWVEGDEESRGAFRVRTRKRQEELAELGWQDASAAAQQPASTADGTASAATAAPSASGAAGQEVQRPRRQQPSRSSAPHARRLPADIRQQLEQMQQHTQQVTPAHSHQPARTSGHLSQQSRLPPMPPPPQALPHPPHRHHCSHPHEDCTSECCSAPTLGGNSQGTAAAALAAAAVAAGGALPDQLLLQSPASLTALVAALGAAQQARQAGGMIAPPPAMLTAEGTAGMRIWEQLLPPLSPQQQEQQQPADTSPELPPEVLSLVEEVFLHTKGEAGAARVATFLRRQCLASLSDFEFLELAMLQQGLGGDMPPLLLNKFLQLGRKRGAAAAAAVQQAPAAEATADGAGSAQAEQARHQQQDHSPAAVAAAACCGEHHHEHVATE